MARRRVPPLESAIGDAKKAARQILEKGLKPGNVRGPTTCPILRRALLRLTILPPSPMAPMTVDQIREHNKQFAKGEHSFWVPMFGDSYTRPVVYHDIEAKRVVALARGGDKDAGAVLCEIGSRFIAGSCTMPPILRDYFIDRLGPEHFPAKPGQPGRKANLHRDVAIVSAVAELVNCGIRATRNDASEHECACSIVAELLEDLDVELAYHGVAKVWSKRGRVLTTRRSRRRGASA